MFFFFYSVSYLLFHSCQSLHESLLCVGSPRPYYSVYFWFCFRVLFTVSIVILLVYFFLNCKWYLLINVFYFVFCLCLCPINSFLHFWKYRLIYNTIYSSLYLISSLSFLLLLYYELCCFSDYTNSWYFLLQGKIFSSTITVKSDLLLVDARQVGKCRACSARQQIKINPIGMSFTSGRLGWRSRKYENEDVLYGDRHFLNVKTNVTKSLFLHMRNCV